MRKLEEYWWGKKEEEESSDDAWSNYSPNDDNDAIQVGQEQFDNHKLMEDDDDIIDLDDYLIQQDASYYVNEEEERFKERKSKLLGFNRAYPTGWIRRIDLLLGACSYMLRHSYVLDVILHEILNICHLLIMPSCDLVYFGPTCSYAPSS
ncbi:hypothetical protein Tco_1428524 [Tanacetum coccineum]